MPFVLNEVRGDIAKKGYQIAKQVGSLCYIFYHEMLVRFLAKPSWTMIHKLKKEYVINPLQNKHIEEVKTDLRKADKIFAYGEMFDVDDLYTAASLAFDVFFYFYAIPYEEKKRKENGGQ